jgi:hypothetical protein
MTSATNPTVDLSLERRCRAVDEQLAGEAVDRRWESEHWHAVASLRYGAMSRPSPSAGLPPPEPEDPRHAYAVKRLKRIEERERGAFVDV